MWQEVAHIQSVCWERYKVVNLSILVGGIKSLQMQTENLRQLGERVLLFVRRLSSTRWAVYGICECFRRRKLLQATLKIHGCLCDSSAGGITLANMLGKGDRDV